MVAVGKARAFSDLFDGERGIEQKIPAPFYSAHQQIVLRRNPHLLSEDTDEIIFRHSDMRTDFPIPGRPPQRLIHELNRADNPVIHFLFRTGKKPFLRNLCQGPEKHFIQTHGKLQTVFRVMHDIIKEFFRIGREN